MREIDNTQYIVAAADTAESKDTPEQAYLEALIAQHSAEGGHLYLMHTFFDQTEMPRLAEALKADTTLKKLTLWVVSLDKVGAAAIAEIIKNNTSLEEIFLAGRIRFDEVVTIAAAFEQNTTLKCISFHCSWLDDMCVTAIASMLEKNTALQRLVLDFNNIGEAGVAALAKAIEKNTVLESISLEQNQLSDAAASLFATALCRNSTLTELSLGYNKIGDPGVADLAEMLKTNTKLQRLSLLGNADISQKGARAIAEALKINTALGEVSLNCNRLSIAAEDEEIARDIRHMLFANSQFREDYPAKLSEVVQDQTRIAAAVVGIVQAYIGEIYPPRLSASSKYPGQFFTMPAMVQMASTVEEEVQGPPPLGLQESVEAKMESWLLKG